MTLLLRKCPPKTYFSGRKVTVGSVLTYTEDCFRPIEFTGISSWLTWLKFPSRSFSKSNKTKGRGASLENGNPFVLSITGAVGGHSLEKERMGNPGFFSFAFRQCQQSNWLLGNRYDDRYFCMSRGLWEEQGVEVPGRTCSVTSTDIHRKPKEPGGRTSLPGQWPRPLTEGNQPGLQKPHSSWVMSITTVTLSHGSHKHCDLGKNHAIGKDLVSVWFLFLLDSIASSLQGSSQGYNPAKLGGEPHSSSLSLLIQSEPIFDYILFRDISVSSLP